MNELTTRERILDISKKVFNDIGIGQTTMNILADETGYARRTLYRYFDSKEDIAYQVLQLYMKEWNQAQKQLYAGLEGNGLQKFEQQFLRVLDYMEGHIHIIRFMGDFDYYFRDSMEYQADTLTNENLNVSFHSSDKIFENIIREGVADGSIALKEDLSMLVATMTNVLWVFGQAIALRGEHITRDAGVDAVEMFRCQIRLYMDAMRA